MNGEKYGKKFKGTAIVGVYLNMDEGVLQFSLNSEIFPKAFVSNDLKEGPIYPAISLLRHTTVSLISGKTIPSGFAK